MGVGEEPRPSRGQGSPGLGDVRALLSRHPEIALKLVAGLVRRLRPANVRISRQSFQTVPIFAG